MIHTGLDLIANLALLVALSNISGFIRQRWERGPWAPVLQGVLFGTIAIFGMLRPLVLGPGLIFDGRSVVLSLCAFFFGPVAALLAGALAAGCRILQGGMGTLTGILVILASIATGLAFRAGCRRRSAPPSFHGYFSLGVATHLAMLALMLTLPGGAGPSVLARIGIPVLSTFPLVTVLIAWILSGHIAGIRTMEALKESEEMHRAILQTSPDGIVITDLDFRVTMASAAALRMHGYTRAEEILGHSISDLVCAQDRVRADSINELLLQGQVTRLGEFQGLRKDGSTFHLEVHGDFIRNADGKPTRIVFAVREITERKQAEEAIRQIEASWSEFVRHSPIHVYIKSVSPTESRVLQASENFVDMIGIPAKDMIGKTMEELFPPEFAAKMTADDWAVVQRNEILRLDEDLNGRNYTSIKFPIHVGTQALLAGYTIDITTRIQAERALRESESRLQLLLNSTAEGIYGIDLQGRCTFCNAAGLRLTGYATAEDLLGKNMHDQIHHTHADGSAFREADCRIFQAFRQGEGTHVDDEVLWRADGTSFPAEYWSYPQRVDGRVVGAVVTFVDITNRLALEQERRHLETQLQHVQKMESMGSLAGGVAHDMNNVLGAIMGLASASLERHPPGSPDHKAFDTILKASERGGKMVRSLLNFARQNLAEERDLNLNDLIRDEVSLLERTTLARVQLGMELAPDLRPMRGDANTLTHAIMNLCVNAVDAMPEGGTLTLRTSNVDADWIEIQVQDAGTGMPPETLAKAMDPFFTTKAQGKGTGLGLSLVYSTVKAHRGQMDIRSEVGHGTTVCLRFPAIPVAIDTPAPEAAHPATGTSGVLSVLLVDDDELIRSSLQALLELLGHETAAVGTGEEALERLEAGLQPDVVILDMNMPGLGGAGTLPRLRTLRPDLPVLLATGRADQSALQLVGAHPFVTLLSKPFGLAELRRQLQAIRPSSTNPSA